jgi:hypothetical protein
MRELLMSKAEPQCQQQGLPFRDSIEVIEMTMDGASSFGVD